MITAYLGTLNGGAAEHVDGRRARIQPFHHPVGHQRDRHVPLVSLKGDSCSMKGCKLERIPTNDNDSSTPAVTFHRAKCPVSADADSNCQRMTTLVTRAVACAMRALLLGVSEAASRWVVRMARVIGDPSGVHAMLTSLAMP